MNKLNIIAIALATGLAFSTGAMALSMSKDEYKGRKDGIATEYKTAKAGCGSFAANAKDICMAEAKGREKIAKADLEERYKPAPNTRYRARIARAEADYSVAREKCDDQAGNV